MPTADTDETQRLIAWALVIAMHLGLFWLLGSTPAPRRVEADTVRMRLVLLARPAPPRAERASSAEAAVVRRPQARLIERRPIAGQAPVALADEAVAVAVEAQIDWQRQARAAAVQQTASVAASFESDPLRSRRARLPGGDRPGAFAMGRALSPADMLGMIGGLFGSYPAPCPRVRENIAGLLTSTSDHDRELLQEELRQQREYCAP